MSNIIGEAFSEYVTKQIQARQKSLSKIQPTQADLKYRTTKAPWLRLASAVDLVGTRKGTAYNKLRAILPEETLKSDFAGSSLARNFVLQGTPLQYFKKGDPVPGSPSETFEKNTWQKPAGGLIQGNNIFNGTYGWGGIKERGYVHPPGITNDSIDYFSDGALTKTTVNIKCYSTLQFSIIDILFLRPGYTCLLEWGWSSYLNNDGGFETKDMINTKAFNYLFNPKTTSGQYGQYAIGAKIEASRKLMYGNYDAVYGKVSKFSWTFNPDGSYDIVMEMIGMGSVIQGLKMNVAAPSTENEQEEDKENPATPLMTSKNLTFLNKYIYDLAASLHKHAISEAKDGKDSEGYAWSSSWDLYLNDCYYDGNPKGTKLRVPNGAGIVSCTHPNNGVNNVTEAGKISGFQYFMKLGALLAFIEGKCGAFTTTSKGKVPLIAFDFKYEGMHCATKDDEESGIPKKVGGNTKEGSRKGRGKNKLMRRDRNYCLYIPNNLSADPNVCMVDWKAMNIGGMGKVKYPFSDAYTLQKTFLSNTNFLISSEPYLGRMANIMVNLNYISEKLTNMDRNDDGSISIFDFIQEILDGISEAMGSINSFTMMYDEGTGKIKIYDDIPPTYKTNIGKLGDEICKINTFGLKPGVEGSFVKAVNLNAELSDEFASMIAIGAQASGNQLNGNATSFSMYNKGLEDRMLPDKLDYHTANKDADDPEKSHEELLIENWDNNINLGAVNNQIKNGTKSLLSRVYGRGGDGYLWTDDYIKDFVNHMTTHVQLLQGIMTENKKKLAAPFFIPFNLQLDLDGIAGIRMYEKFKMNDNILPPSYTKGGVDIIVKAINHAIDPTGWTTKLETISVPSHDVEDVKKQEEEDKKETEKEREKVEELYDEEELETSEVPTEGSVEDAKLRMRLTRVMDDGRQTLGIMELIAEDEKTTVFRLATNELPWLNNKNDVSCVPPGRYWVRTRYHSSNKKHGKCFILMGRESDNWGKGDSTWKNTGGLSSPAAGDIRYGGYKRKYILIHRCFYAVGWLQGCIGMGFAFNTHQLTRDNPKGTATPEALNNRGPDQGQMPSKYKEKGYVKSAMKESLQAMSMIRRFFNWDEIHEKNSIGFFIDIRLETSPGVYSDSPEGYKGEKNNGIPKKWVNSEGPNYQSLYFKDDNQKNMAEKYFKDNDLAYIAAGTMGDDVNKAGTRWNPNDI